MHPHVCFQGWTVFQSTLSMRRATYRLAAGSMVDAISIHALHEESDQRMMYHKVWRIFQSTLSMRRATQAISKLKRYNPISIHALHEESDQLVGWRAVEGV